jgi:ubiquitin carboxyl-terminal hydrolase L3
MKIRYCSASVQIDEAHEAVAQEGQSAVIEDTWQHFVAFVDKGGHLYELDGRKSTPINHGPTSDATFLEDAARVIREFMSRDEGELRFTMVALAKTVEEEDEEVAA